MKGFKELLRRVLHLGRARRFDTELDDEMQFHVESRAAELEAAGKPRSQAISQAHREFGSRLRASENTREAWRFLWIEDLLSDLRLAARSIRRNPGFAAAAILSLAVGAGLNTAIFSVTLEFLLSEPSCRDASTLRTASIGGSFFMPGREFRFVRQSETFPGVTGVFEHGEVNWRNGDETVRLLVFAAGDNYFDVVGPPLARGRGFHTGEKNAAVISHWFWQRRLGGIEDVLGRSLVLDGRPYTIVGVLPREHKTLLGFGLAPDLYYVPPTEGPLRAIVRTAAGMSDQEIRSRLTAVSRELDRTYPDTNRKWAEDHTVSGVSGIDRMRTLTPMMPVYVFFGLVMALVGLVLLVACANVAGLLLARAAGRAHEIAVRMAIGAGRGRVVRHFLAESLLLAACGTAVGLLLNYWATRLVERIDVSAPIPVRLVVDPDWRLALYAALIVTISALVSGLAPALNAARLHPQGSLKLGEQPTISGRFGLRRVLVAGQLAVSVVLLATGFLFLRSLLIVSTRPPGFDVEKTVWVQTRLVAERYPTPESRRTMVERGVEVLRLLPGVESVAPVDVVPLNDNYWMATRMSPDDGKESVPVRCYVNTVGDDYFRTMRIGIVAGREFGDADTAEGPPVVILNSTLARRLFGAANPVGRIVRQGESRLTVVGVAADSKYFTIGEENPQALYWPWSQKRRFRNQIHYLVRTAGSPDVMAKSANKVMGALDVSAAVESKPLKRALGFALLPSQVGAALLGSIGLLALLLAAIGLYGLISYTVASKLREMGLRIALGATPADILRLVGREAFTLLGVGIVAGLAIAWAVSRPLARFVVAGPSPVDLVSFGAVIAILGFVGLVATIGPARKALRVSPIVALRYE